MIIIIMHYANNEKQEMRYGGRNGTIKPRKN